MLWAKCFLENAKSSSEKRFRVGIASLLCIKRCQIIQTYRDGGMFQAKGILTDEEFLAKKSELLSRI